MTPRTPGPISLICLGLLTLTTTPAGARTWIIQPDGSGDAPTVQAAIDAAENGDLIEVRAGMYYETLDFQGKAIQVRGEGPEVTQVSAIGLDRSVVTFRNGETRDAVLEGLTLTGGRGVLEGTARYGGGIYILDSEPTVRGNRILGNALPTLAEGYGGGIACFTSPGGSLRSPLLENNILEENAAGTGGGGIAVGNLTAPVIRGNQLARNEGARGGGIWIAGPDAAPIIEKNRIERNLAEIVGGGIYGEQTTGTTRISENLIAGNAARGSQDDGGGAILLVAVQAEIRGNTIVRNRVHGPTEDWGGSVVLLECPEGVVERNILAFAASGEGLRCSGSTMIIRDNLLWQNGGPETGGTCSGWWETDGNLVADPELCGFDQGDYRPSNDSPALHHPAGPLGAFPDPGCGATPVAQTTWGALKARY